VRQRAGDRCEYCLLPQSAYPLSFELDHIVAIQHGAVAAATQLRTRYDGLGDTMAKKAFHKSTAVSAKAKSKPPRPQSSSSAGRASRSSSSAYVRTDAGGALRVGTTDLPLDSVVAAFHQGHSPEMIRAQYLSLTLEEAYGAIAYYLAHRKDVDAYLQRQDALWSQWRARADAAAAPVVQRLKGQARASASLGGKPA
jgi:uncharacterized protein (DUF433 family)